MAASVHRNDLPSLGLTLRGRLSDVGALHTCPSRAFEVLCGNLTADTPKRLAVLVYGMTRTMTEPDIVADYVQLMKLAKNLYSYVHLFAYLDPGSDGADAQKLGADVDMALHRSSVPYELVWNNEASFSNLATAHRSRDDTWSDWCSERVLCERHFKRPSAANSGKDYKVHAHVTRSLEP